MCNINEIGVKGISFKPNAINKQTHQDNEAAPGNAVQSRQDHGGDIVEEDDTPHARQPAFRPPQSPEPDDPELTRDGKTGRMPVLRHALFRGLRPLRGIWTWWTTTPRDSTPDPDFDLSPTIHHPRDATDGLWILRLWDRIDWYLTLPDARYELYDLKLRRRRFDGLEWRLHLLRCWIRNEPRGLPPGLQPSTDYPGHDELRARISPATAGFTPTPVRYDPVANGVTGHCFDPYHPVETATWTGENIGPIPPDQPPQLVFEHVPAAVFPGEDAGRAYTRWVRESTNERLFVEALLRHRQPLKPHEMPFFDAWPEIPREHASRVNVTLATSGVPLGGWGSVLWVDRIGDEWRLFRQAISGRTGYPLGAANTWPITGENLKWLEQPVNPPAAGVTS